MNATVLNGRTYNGFGDCSISEIRRRENRKWRREVVRRQRIVLSAFIAVILSIIISFGVSIMINAKSNDSAPMVKYYTVTTVHAGDTLEGLAKERFSKEHYESFDAYINEILRINHLDAPEDLKAGENVVIPYYDIYK